MKRGHDHTIFCNKAYIDFFDNLEKHFSTKNIKTKGNKAMGMKFGQAVEHAKLGGKVAREGWNGKGMFVFFGFPKVEVNTGSTGMGATSGDAAEHFGCKYQATGCLCMKTAQNTIQVGWLASQSDMLAEDWEDVT